MKDGDKAMLILHDNNGQEWITAMGDYRAATEWEAQSFERTLAQNTQVPDDPVVPTTVVPTAVAPPSSPTSGVPVSQISYQNNDAENLRIALRELADMRRRLTKSGEPPSPKRARTELYDASGYHFAPTRRVGPVKTDDASPVPFLIIGGVLVVVYLST